MANDWAPVSSQGFAPVGSGLSSGTETAVVFALFGVGLLALIIFGFIGANLNGGASATVSL